MCVPVPAFLLCSDTYVQTFAVSRFVVVAGFCMLHVLAGFDGGDVL